MRIIISESGITARRAHLFCQLGMSINVMEEKEKKERLIEDMNRIREEEEFTPLEAVSDDEE